MGGPDALASTPVVRYQMGKFPLCKGGCMDFLVELWLPILLSAVACFILSSIA